MDGRDMSQAGAGRGRLPPIRWIVTVIAPASATSARRPSSRNVGVHQDEGPHPHSEQTPLAMMTWNRPATPQERERLRERALPARRWHRATAPGARGGEKTSTPSTRTGTPGDRENAPTPSRTPGRRRPHVRGEPRDDGRAPEQTRSGHRTPLGGKAVGNTIEVEGAWAPASPTACGRYE